MAAKFKDLGSGHLAFYCPGCKECHVIDAKGWNFDGNYNAPTTSPSIRISMRVMGKDVTQCHSWITGGKITFYADSIHNLKNTTVELPDWDAPRD